LAESNPRREQDKAANDSSKKQGEGDGKELGDAEKGSSPTIGEEADRYANEDTPGKNGQAQARNANPADRIDPSRMEGIRPERAESAATVAPSGGAGLAEGLIGNLPLGSGQGFINLKKNKQFADAALQIAMNMVEASKRTIQFISKREEMGDHFAPVGGFTSSLDDDKFQRLVESRRTGRPLTSADDLRLYRDQKDVVVPALLTTLIGIDGSGSMGSGPGSYMAYCAEMLGLMAMASRETAMLSEHRKAVNETWAFVWGDSDPRPVLAPDTDEHIEACAIDSVIQGIRSGTSLAPFVPKSARVMADKMESSLTSSLSAAEEGLTYFGMLNVQIYSDGGTYAGVDGPDKQALAGLLENPFVTLDVFITGGAEDELSKITRKLQEEYGEERVALHSITNAREIPLIIYKSSEERFLQAQQLIAEMPEERVEALKQLAARAEVVQRTNY